MNRRWHRLLVAAAFLSAALAAPAAAEDGALKPVVASVRLDADSDSIWRAWTTEAGVRSFLAPESHIEPRVGGAYEIYFLPDQPKGLRGSEGATVLAWEPPHRLMFSWNAPVQFDRLRIQLTVVEVAIEDASDGGSNVTLTHSGWGRGTEWQAVRDYFSRAWPAVLSRLASGRLPN